MLHTIFVLLASLWGVITATLVCLIIYRGTLIGHEDDQMFLDGAVQSIADEQKDVVKRIDHLDTPIRSLWVLSGILLVAAGGLWLYLGFQSF
jgi:hypothetical protein